jgi:hypothetical protein
MKHEELSQLKRRFAAQYLDRSRGVFSVGIGREDGQACLRVSGTARALESIPHEFDGMRVTRRLGSPGITAIGQA